MPLRKGKQNVGYNMKELKKAHPTWSHKRILAASLHAAGVKRKTGRN